MKRKILSLILVFAMTVSLLTVGTGAVEPTYGDTAGHWAESSIERWSAYGIIQGSNGQFDPNGQLTCAQLATILAKLLKLPAAKDAGFTDNTADAWYYDAINRCAAAGILNGNGDGTVTPEAPITRERAMVMLARALGIEPIRKPDLTKYTDAAQVSAYAQGMVAAMIEAGIVGGVTADELAPQANINRASTVTILDRAIGVYADKDGMTVNAKDGELVLVVAKNVKVINAPEGTKIVVADGATGLTVNGKSVSDDQTYIVPKTTSSGSSSGGYSHTHSYDATTHKCSCGEFAPDVVATIGDTNGYLTLKAAVAAATNGATVKLVKGALLDADISISSKITLDLNGNTIETNGKKISVAGAGDLTVTGNGIINNQVDADKAGGTTNRYTMLSVEEGGKLTIENGTFTTKAAQIVYTYGSTTIRGGTFKNTSTSEETVDALNSGALIVVCGTPASLTMTGGTVTTESQYLYGVFVQDGGNAIFGDEETKNGPSIHTHRYAAIGENNTMPTANITIYGGEYTVSTDPASDAWKPFCATIYASASGDINIYGGTFNGYYGISSRYVNVGQNLNISGGTFNGSNSALFVDTKSGVECSETRTISITGGTFSTEPANEYIAKGYTKERDNGKWNVVPDTSKTYVAQVGVNKYESLADALAAAKDGDTVKLTKDIAPTERIEVTGDKNITIDLAAKKITSTADVAIVNNGTGKLTITGNGTVDTSSSANDKNIAIWARTGSIDIENGMFINKSNKEATVYVGTSADASTPVITIKGGTFENKATGPYEYKNSLKPLTLNVENSKPVTSIVITGGTFVGQNPGDGDDNKGGTFLAEGCITLVNNDTFTVSNTDEIPVTTATVQDYLDGKYGSINGKTLVLASGDYSALKLAPAAYAGSNTTYTCPHNDPTNNTGSVTFTSVVEYKQHMSDNPHHGSARIFTRTLNNLTITAQNGAEVTIAGFEILSRTYDGDSDPFAEGKTGYEVVLNVKNLTFSNVKFTAKVEISSTMSATTIDGVTFNSCVFETEKVNNPNKQALNFSNSLNNGNVRNLKVDGCKFNNCYQGVYTNTVKNILVTSSEFSGIYHNAIAVQTGNGADDAVNHGNVVISGNNFTDINDRIIRFNKVGAGTHITITNNAATNCNAGKEAIKAESLDGGVTYTISGNDWGNAGAPANNELKDSLTGPM